MQTVLTWAAVAFGGILMASFAGALHPAGDALAVFAPVWAVAFALAVIWTAWPRRVRWPLAFVAMGALLWMFWPNVVSHPEGTLRVYQKNLRFNAADTAAIAQDIVQSGADVVTLQEVSDRTIDVIGQLRPRYPHYHFCPFSAVGGTAVLSRWPILPDRAQCPGRGGLTLVQLATPDGPLWAASLHLHCPWPFQQGAHLATLLPALQRLEGPVVLGGDFNMVPWSQTMRALRRAVLGQRAGRVERTFAHKGVPLPIDHVIAPGGGSTRLRPQFSSDHYGVLADVVVNW